MHTESLSIRSQMTLKKAIITHVGKAEERFITLSMNGQLIHDTQLLRFHLSDPNDLMEEEKKDRLPGLDVRSDASEMPNLFRIEPQQVG